MSAQLRTQIGSIVLVSGLLAVMSANKTRAADCLASPNSSAPKNSHWYYRTDRSEQHKCWHLGAADQSPQQATPQTAREAPPAKPSPSSPAASRYSLENFKDFMAQRGSTNLSDKDVEKLYAEFLEWSRPFR
jgi:hypothetical protein